MTPFPITSIYAALCSLLVLVLALRVAQFRNRQQIGIGDGGNRVLERRIRIHANAIENIPLVLILLGLVEASSVAPWILHTAGLTLVVARILHAYGLSRSAGRSFGRLYGVALTWVLLLGLSLCLLLRPLLT